MSNKEYIYNFLMDKLGNKKGVCALMGNLYAESGLVPNNLQNSGNRKLGLTDEEYTSMVDNGSYGNFVYDSQGYGLAQWTYWARKKNLLEYARTKNLSIGSLDMQLNFLVSELKAYRSVYNAIVTATDIKTCSDVIVKQYERPANQSEDNLRRRANWGISFYQEIGNVKETTKEDNKGFILYKVERGNTLWGIASRFYGSGTKYPIIMEDNNLKSTTIQVAQVLKIREGL